MYSTYLGGSGDDTSNGMALDSAGNAYVTGSTYSDDFPIANAFQPHRAAGSYYADAFVTKLNAVGSALVYSTYLGGGFYGAQGHGVAVDSAGNAYVGGVATSGFPTVNALQATWGGSIDGFVTKLNPAGSALVYSTYLGGSAGDAVFAITVDSSGNAYVTGRTASTNFPTANALQPALAGGLNAFVAKLNATGSQLVYSTYLGGGWDEGLGIAVDSMGRACVIGDTESTDFPTANPFQASSAGFYDVFLTKINAAGSALVFSTYLGGNGYDSELGAGIALDSAGNAYMTGRTDSTNFPLVNALQPTYSGYGDAFVAKISFPPVSLSPAAVNLGNEPLGGTSDSRSATLSNEGSTAVTISSIDITGTNAGDFGQTNNCGTSVAAGASCTINVTFTPTALGSRTATLSVTDDAPGSPYTAALTGTGTAPAVSFSAGTLTFSTQPVGVASAAQPVILSNTGNAPLTVSSIAVTGTNTGDFAQTNNCGSSLAAGNSCTIGVTFTPLAGGTRGATLSVTDNASGSPHSVGLSGTGAAVPELTISVAHSGNFTQNQTDATYTISVSNLGTLPSSGTVSVVDTLPTGLTATALAGTGWTCTLGTLTCARSDALAGVSSYPSITLTVDVAADAPASVTNTATVSGGGDITAANNTATDLTTILQPPTADAVTPTPASGANQTFSLAYSVHNGKGYTDLSYVKVLINPRVIASQGCYALYYEPANRLYLENDAGTGMLGPLTPGSAGTLANSQCTLNGTGTTVSGSGATLTLKLSVSAASSFLGARNIYMMAQDSEGTSSGWQNRGTWTPIGADTAPTADTVTPTPASGANQTFSLAYSVHNGKGYADLTYVRALVNPSVSPAQGCYVLYYLPANWLYLENDAGTGMLGPLTPGSARTLANSQCTVNGTGTTASGSGATLTLDLSLSASSSFLGTRNIYMLAQDSEGTSSGWQNRGTWTPIGADTAPTADTVTPTPASGTNQTFSLTYSVQNGKGYTDLTWVSALFNWGQSGTNGCYVRYYQPANQLYLRNDASTADLGPLTPGTAGTLSNSQCTLNGSGSSVGGSGKSLVLNLSLSAQSGFTGTKKVFMWAIDSEGTNSGWQNRGAWTP